MPLANRADKVDSGEEGAHSDGAFIEGLQNPLCPKCYTKSINLFAQDTKSTCGLPTGYETSKTMSMLFTIKTPTALGFLDCRKRNFGCKNGKSSAFKVKKIDRPNTKWVFESTAFVELKTILDRQPLQIGLGRLPDWLRNKREVISLDTFNDDLCVFRCLAVHLGADKQYNTRKTRELARSCFDAHPKPRGNGITLRQFHLLEKLFKQGITAYTVTNNGDFV